MNTPELKEEQPVASPIEAALVKANVTEQVLAELKTLKSLTINGIDDKAGYEKVKEARIRCMRTRSLAKKICEKGREDAIAEQRKWIAKEKEVTAQIQDVEDYLEKQEKAIDDEKARIKAEKERAEQARIQQRVSILLGMGMQFNGVQYNLSGNVIDSHQVKNMPDDEFKAFCDVVQAEADSIKALAQKVYDRRNELATYGYTHTGDLASMTDDEYNTVLSEQRAIFEEKQRESERLEEQRIQQQKDREKFEQEQREFQEKKAREEAELQAEKERVQKDKQDFLHKRQNSRTRQLLDLGLQFNGDSFLFNKEGVYINFHHTDVLCFEDDRWDKEYTGAKTAVDDYNAQQKEIQQKEQKAREEKAADQARIDEQNRIKKAEEDKKAEEERLRLEEQERINDMNDKDKMIVLLNAIQDSIDSLEKDCPEFKTKKANNVKVKVFGVLNSASDLIRENYK
jgi:hypothetical protein